MRSPMCGASRGCGRSSIRNSRGRRSRRSNGIAPPRFVYPYVIEDAGNIIKGRPFDDGTEDSPLLADFRGKLAKLTIDEAKRESLLARGGDRAPDVGEAGLRSA